MTILRELPETKSPTFGVKDWKQKSRNWPKCRTDFPSRLKIIALWKQCASFFIAGLRALPHIEFYSCCGRRPANRRPC